jgi:hypothetical protein
MAQSEASEVIASLFGLMIQPPPNQTERLLQSRRKPHVRRTPVWDGVSEAATKEDLEEFPPAPAAALTEAEIKKERARLLESAANESKALFGLIRPGNRETVRSVRELILVPQKEREALFAFAKENPMEGGRILGAMRFRAMVLDAFESLVQSAEHVERIAAAEAEAAQRAALEAPALPLLHELVVCVTA